MEALTTAQEEIGQEIQSIIRNYKKDSSTRKTRDYLKKRFTQIEAKWENFLANHQELALFAEEHSTHPYFMNNYFNGIKQAYEAFKNELSMALQHCEPDQATNPTPGPAPGASKISKGTNDQGKHLELKSTKIVSAVQERADLERLRSLIRLQKSKMISLQNHLKTIDAQIAEEHPRIYYEHKLRLVEDYWRSIVSQHEKILELASEVEDQGYQESNYIEMELWVENVIVNLSTRLAEAIPTSRSTTVNNAPQPKLPKITLPVFNGNYLQWKHFRDLFLQLIHNQPISLSEKMYYLTSNLTGEAKSLIQHIPISEENYLSAWETLENRYNNQRLLITTILNRLLGQPNIQHESAVALKQLHDTTKECLMGLSNLGVSIETWDPILSHLTIKKLDRTTHNLYEQSLTKPREPQPIKGLLSFLEMRFQALEALGKKDKFISSTAMVRKDGNFKSSFVSTTAKGCLACPNSHPLFTCKKFLDLSPQDRLNLLKRNKRCINCLRDSHPISKCPLRGCQRCTKKHNTLVHMDERTSINTQNSKSTEPVKKVGDLNEIQPVHSSTLSASAANDSRERMYIFLSTALINVLDKHGTPVECRAILDTGSQLNFITERLCKKLGLRDVPDILQVNGIGHTKQRAQRRVNITIRSRHTGFSAQLDAFILPQITSRQPSQYIDNSSWHIPRNIKLADPTFNQPAYVDLLIGADLFYQLLAVGQIRLGTNLPCLQNTTLGWIVGGKVIADPTNEVSCGIASYEAAQIQDQLEDRRHQ